MLCAMPFAEVCGPSVGARFLWNSEKGNFVREAISSVTLRHWYDTKSTTGLKIVKSGKQLIAHHTISQPGNYLCLTYLLPQSPYRF